jgi:hypothetical protein
MSMWRCRACLSNGQRADKIPELDNHDMMAHLRDEHRLDGVGDFVDHTILQRGGNQGKNRGPRPRSPKPEQLMNEEWAPGV